MCIICHKRHYAKTDEMINLKKLLLLEIKTVSYPIIIIIVGSIIFTKGWQTSLVDQISLKKKISKKSHCFHRLYISEHEKEYGWLEAISEKSKEI